MEKMNSSTEFFPTIAPNMSTTLLQERPTEASGCPIDFNPVFHISVLIIALFILCANFLVIYLFAHNRNLRKNVANFLLLSLSLNDLCTGVACLMMLLPHYYIAATGDCDSLYERFTLTYHAAYDMLNVALTIIAVLHLLLLSTERFISLYYALRYAAIVTRNRIVGLLIGAWLFGAFVSLIQLKWNVPYLRNSQSQELYMEKSRLAKIYTIVTITTFAIIPVFVLLFQYVWLFSLIRRLVRTECGTRFRKRSRREMKAIIIYCVMFVSFVVFCCPLLVVKLMLAVNAGIGGSLAIEVFETISALRFIISLVNPIIYALYKKDFKKAIRKTCGFLPKSMLQTGRPMSSRFSDNTSFIEHSINNNESFMIRPQRREATVSYLSDV